MSDLANATLAYLEARDATLNAASAVIGKVGSASVEAAAPRVAPRIKRASVVWRVKP